MGMGILWLGAGTGVLWLGTGMGVLWFGTEVGVLQLQLAITSPPPATRVAFRNCRREKSFFRFRFMVVSCENIQHDVTVLCCVS